MFSLAYLEGLCPLCGLVLNSSKLVSKAGLELSMGMERMSSIQGLQVKGFIKAPGSGSSQPTSQRVVEQIGPRS